MKETAPKKDGYTREEINEKGIEYENIMPAQKLSKLPVITADKDSEHAWVYAELMT